MDFRVLGHLEVREGEHVRPVGGGRQVALLAALLLHTNSVVRADELIEWLKSRTDFRVEMEAAYRNVCSFEQLRIAEDLADLHETAGVLLVVAQGHGIISAKIASTVHDTFHAFMLAELDHHGKTTPELFEQSVSLAVDRDWPLPLDALEAARTAVGPRFRARHLEATLDRAMNPVVAGHSSERLCGCDTMTGGKISR